MFKSLITAVAILTASTTSLYAAPKDDVAAAAKKLADADNYSWKSTTEGGFSSTAQGQTQKDGLTPSKSSSRGRKARSRPTTAGRPPPRSPISKDRSASLAA